MRKFDGTGRRRQQHEEVLGQDFRGYLRRSRGYPGSLFATRNSGNTICQYDDKRDSANPQHSALYAGQAARTRHQERQHRNPTKRKPLTILFYTRGAERESRQHPC